MEELNLFDFILSETRLSKRTDIHPCNSFKIYLDSLVEFDKQYPNANIKSIHEYFDKFDRRHKYGVARTLDYIWFGKQNVR